MDLIINSTNQKLVEFNNNFVYLYVFKYEYYAPLNKILKIINGDQYLEEVLNSSIFKLAIKHAFNPITKEKITIIKTSFLNLIKLKFGLVNVNFITMLQPFDDLHNQIKETIESKVTFDKEERSQINEFVRKLCKDNKLDYQKTWSNIYKQVERKRGCDLNLKLESLRIKYINEGRHKRINKLDVIFSDPQLIKICQSVISDMGIKSGKVTY